MNLNNESTGDPVRICDMIGNFFKSAYEPTQLNMETWISSTEVSPNATNIFLGLDSIEKLLLSLDVSKASGSGGIGPIFLKQEASSLKFPLFIKLKKSLNFGVFPTIWKTGNIIPVQKSNNKDNITNYRPI